MTGTIKRSRKKIIKLRGGRTMGSGNTKNKRGKGCRGGKGRAGSTKHKFSKYYKSLGQYGFTALIKKTTSEINTELMSHLVSSGSLGAEEKGVIVVDLKKAGYNKLLGTSNVFKVDKPLRIIVDAASASAKKIVSDNKWDLVVSSGVSRQT